MGEPLGRPHPWTTEPARVVAAAAHVGEHARARTGAVEVLVAEAGALVRATPRPDGGWGTATWLLSAEGHDPGTTMLALEVLAGTCEQPETLGSLSAPALGEHPRRWLPALHLSLFADPVDADPGPPEHLMGGLWVLNAIVGTAHTARTARSHAWLTDRCPGLVLDSAGGACPFQAEGTWDGHPFYFRYRGGWATLSVGGADPVAHPIWSAGDEHGDSLDGWLSDEEFARLFHRLAGMLTRSPYHYRYDVHRPDGQPVEQVWGNGRTSPARVSGWGHTREQAHADAMGNAVSHFGPGPLVLVTDDVDDRDPALVAPPFTIHPAERTPG